MKRDVDTPRDYLAAVRRDRDAESRASHSRKPRCAGLGTSTYHRNDGSGLAGDECDHVGSEDQESDDERADRRK